MIPDAVVTGALRVRIAEGVDIREILRTPGGSLVAEEGLSTDEWHLVGTESAALARPPDFIPGDAINLAHHVNLDWRDAHFDDLASAGDIRRDQRFDGKSERGDCVQQALAVLSRRLHQNVEITGESRRTVKRQRVCADDDELNAAGEQ